MYQYLTDWSSFCQRLFGYALCGVWRLYHIFSKCGSLHNEEAPSQAYRTCLIQKEKAAVQVHEFLQPLLAVYCSVCTATLGKWTTCPRALKIKSCYSSPRLLSNHDRQHKSGTSGIVFSIVHISSSLSSPPSTSEYQASHHLSYISSSLLSSPSFSSALFRKKIRHQNLLWYTSPLYLALCPIISISTPIITPPISDFRIYLIFPVLAHLKPSPYFFIFISLSFPFFCFGDLGSDCFFSAG